MSSKLEEAMDEIAFSLIWEGAVFDEPRVVYAAVAKLGVKWLLEEAKKLAFPNNTEDQVVRLSDLEKIVGEE